MNSVIEIFWIVQLNSNLKNLDLYNYTDSFNSNKGKNLVKSTHISLNGYDLFNEIDSSFTEYVTVFQSHLRSSKVTGLNIYSFALKPEVSQPSSTCNFSRIEKAYINVILNNIINYNNQATLKIICRSYNILRIVNGVVEVLF